MLRRVLQWLTARPAAPEAVEDATASPALHAAEPLIWAHSPKGLTPEALAGLQDLHKRLLAEAEVPPQLLLTGPFSAELGTVFSTSPTPTATGLSAFLTHWKPCAILWVGTGDTPLALACQGLGKRVTLLTMTATAPFPPGPFGRILQGPLCADPPQPTCNEAEAEDLSRRFRGRPVWLAALPTSTELTALIAAHRTAAQASHRLLLLLILPEGEGASTAQTLHQTGWQVRHREAGQDPDDSCEILVSEGTEELGLWYRLAPVTFLGGSLSDGCTLNPMGPAAMGSALICGPQAGPYSLAIGALDKERALLRVADAQELREAVVRLLAPDQTASLASNGWQVATAGAPLQNQLAELLIPLCTEAAQ